MAASHLNSMWLPKKNDKRSLILGLSFRSPVWELAIKQPFRATRAWMSRTRHCILSSIYLLLENFFILFSFLFLIPRHILLNCLSFSPLSFKLKVYQKLHYVYKICCVTYSGSLLIHVEVSYTWTNCYLRRQVKWRQGNHFIYFLLSPIIC